MAKNYVELNTNLEINQTAIVPALNGRQGDNDREVGFWIKDGKFPMDLSNKTIKLFAKDASGVVKETESINDRTGITAGRFTLLIQKEFYQAVGQVEDSFIQISDKENGQIVSTIPVSFTVLENKMVVTQTQSQVYLDTVQKTIDNFNERIKSAGTNLEVLENAQKHLQSVVDNINQEFNSDVFAKTKEDNDFKGNNTFENPIKATGGIEGNLKGDVEGRSTNSGQADEAMHAMKADNADSAKHAEVADKLVPENNQTVNDLTVKGQLNIGGNQKVVSDYEQRFGGELDIHIDRIGNECLIRFSGRAQGNNWSNIGPERIKLGFRPINDVVIRFNDGAGYCNFVLTSDGSIWRRSNSSNWGGEVFSTETYTTNDSWPE